MRSFMYLSWLAAVLPVLSWAAEIREYPCYRLASEPVIDGKLNDDVWNTIPPCQGFLVLGKGYAPVERPDFLQDGMD